MCVFVCVHTYAYTHALVRLCNDWNSFCQWNWTLPRLFTWALELIQFPKVIQFPECQTEDKVHKVSNNKWKRKVAFTPYSECMHNITRRNNLVRDMAGGRNDCVIQNLKQTEVKNRKNGIRVNQVKSFEFCERGIWHWIFIQQPKFLYWTCYKTHPSQPVWDGRPPYQQPTLFAAKSATDTADCWRVWCSANGICTTWFVHINMIYRHWVLSA